MASHGVARTARARTKEQREQDLDKIDRYRALQDQARLRVKDRQFGQDTFELTSQLLRLNPEHYTVWNVRRRCLVSGLLSASSHGSSSHGAQLASPLTETRPSPGPPSDGERSVESRQKRDEAVIRSELAFTVPLLVEFPKCYWIWKYRLWILAQATDGLSVGPARAIWEEELGLVSKMLHRDRRNFHAWGYRGHVVSQLESDALTGRSMAEPEFEYTTRMIYADLSNFSAWHNRSQLIPRLLQERGADDAARQRFLDAELALVRGALNVGPEDQSLWYYHQYLMSHLAGPSDKGALAPRLAVADRKRRMLGEVAAIRELAEDYADVKWVYEALVEYTLALCRLDGRPLGAGEKGDVKDWLGKLRGLDPKRSGRWDDLEAGLGLGLG